MSAYLHQLLPALSAITATWLIAVVSPFASTREAVRKRDASYESFGGDNPLPDEEYPPTPLSLIRNGEERGWWR